MKSSKAISCFSPTIVDGRDGSLSLGMQYCLISVKRYIKRDVLSASNYITEVGGLWLVALCTLQDWRVSTGEGGHRRLLAFLVRVVHDARCGFEFDVFEYVAREFLCPFSVGKIKSE